MILVFLLFLLMCISQAFSNKHVLLGQLEHKNYFKKFLEGCMGENSQDQFWLCRSAGELVLSRYLNGKMQHWTGRAMKPKRDCMKGPCPMWQFDLWCRWHQSRVFKIWGSEGLGCWLSPCSTSPWGSVLQSVVRFTRVVGQLWERI